MKRRIRPIPHYCPQCMNISDGPPPDGLCPACRLLLKPVLDAHGALTREYLLARKKCCENFCTNCPWGHPARLAAASAR